MEIKNQAPDDNLPKLRNGLSIAFNDYDIEGKPQWVIHDSGRNKFFLVGWLEYEMYERWYLKSKKALINSINNETTLYIEEIDVENFIEFLKRNFLIIMSGHEINKQATSQELFKDDSWIHWLISNYLFFRIPLLHPDKFLTKTKIIGDIIFNRYLLYFMTFLGLIALYQLSTRWELFTHTFSSVFTLKGLFFSLIAFSIGKTCHELGHAYMCRSYGIPVPSMGLAFLVFWPVLYTDTTLSWALSNRQRLNISLAGIWVETYLAIIAALIWCYTDNQTLQAICFVTISVNWLASLLINVSPFMRFDGYYVLADYLKIPNLQHRAFALARWKIRYWLFGWNDPPPEKFTKRIQNLLLVYSFLTWIYRLSLYIGIAVLVYHFFIKIVGIILFAIEVHYFILAPFVREAQLWYSQKEKFSLNTRTKITITVVAMLAILFFTPFTETVKFPATLSHTHQFLIAPEGGILESNLPPVGTKIAAHQPITRIISTKLDETLLETLLEYRKIQSQLRRSQIDASHVEERNILLSDLKRLSAQYQKLMNIKNKLTLTVPFDGVLKEKPLDVFSGSYVMKDQWLGEVVKPGSIVIEAFIPQSDVMTIRIGNAGDFYPHNYSLSSLPVMIDSIEIVNSQQLNCSYSTEVKQQKSQDIVVETPCYNASDLGGEIPTYQNEEGNYVPTTSFYRVTLSTTSKNGDLDHVERGTVFIESDSHSYAYRVFYQIKTIFIEEFGL